MTLWDPMNCSMPDFPSFTISQNFLKLMSIESVMLSKHLILCHPFLLLPSIFPSIRVFPVGQFFTSSGQSIGASVSASILSMNNSGLISFRIDWFDHLCRPKDSQIFSSTTIWKHQFFGTQPSLWANSHICTWLLEKP